MFDVFDVFGVFDVVDDGAKVDRGVDAAQEGECAHDGPVFQQQPGRELESAGVVQSPGRVAQGGGTLLEPFAAERELVAQVQAGVHVEHVGELGAGAGCGRVSIPLT